MTARFGILQECCMQGARLLRQWNGMEWNGTGQHNQINRGGMVVSNASDSSQQTEKLSGIFLLVPL